MTTDDHFSRLEALDVTRDISRLTQGFTGRNWVSAEVDGWMTSASRRFFNLTGEPGVGKSALAARLTQVLSDFNAGQGSASPQAGS